MTYLMGSPVKSSLHNETKTTMELLWASKIGSCVLWAQFGRVLVGTLCWLSLDFVANIEMLLTYGLSISWCNCNLVMHMSAGMTCWLSVFRASTIILTCLTTEHNLCHITHDMSTDGQPIYWPSISQYVSSQY